MKNIPLILLTTLLLSCHAEEAPVQNNNKLAHRIKSSDNLIKVKRNLVDALVITDDLHMNYKNELYSIKKKTIKDIALEKSSILIIKKSNSWKEIKDISKIVFKYKGKLLVFDIEQNEFWGYL